MSSEPERPWGSNFTPEEIAATRERKGLLSMELELSRECNLRCVYCYASSGKALHNELTRAEIDNALDQAIALGARRIIVIGGGEPLMYPGVMDIMRMLRGRGIMVDLFTNGTLITPEIARELFAMGVSPVIKFNSMREEVQDALAAVPGTYKLDPGGAEEPDGRRLPERGVATRRRDDHLPPEHRRFARDVGLGARAQHRPLLRDDHLPGARQAEARPERLLGGAAQSLLRALAHRPRAVRLRLGAAPADRRALVQPARVLLHAQRAGVHPALRRRRHVHRQHPPLDAGRDPRQLAGDGDDAQAARQPQGRLRLLRPGAASATAAADWPITSPATSCRPTRSAGSTPSGSSDRRWRAP